jgi:hypothetical protein
MGNLYLASRYDERIDRLALGIEPVDAMRASRVLHPIRIQIEGSESGLVGARLIRHSSGLFVMLQSPDGPTALAIRLFDLGEPKDPPRYRAETNRRRLVPRRLRIEIPAPDTTDRVDLPTRVCRPALFPGAAYPVGDCVTGLRGRVERGGKPVRWARVQARRPGAAAADPPVGRAHGDDRGEFLLLVEPAAAPMAALEDPFELELLIYPPLPPNPMPPQSVRDSDGLWDLPPETATLGAAPDPVALGDFPPAGWGPPTGPIVIELAYGRILTGRPPLAI